MNLGDKVAIVLVVLAVALVALLAGHELGKNFWRPIGVQEGYREACADVGGETHVLDGVRLCTPPIEVEKPQLRGPEL